MESRNFQESLLVPWRTSKAWKFQQLVSTYLCPHKVKSTNLSFFFPRLLCTFVFSARIPIYRGTSNSIKERVPAIAPLYTTFPEHFRIQVKGVYTSKEKVQTGKINVKEGLCWLAGWGLRKHRHWWNNNLAKCVHWEKPPVLCFTPLSLPCGAPWLLRSLQII